MADVTPLSSTLPILAEPRFRGWSEPTSVTVTPSTPSNVYIRDLELQPNDDSIWVHVTSSGGENCPWPWSYAVLTWVSSEGRELGSTVIHGPCEGEVYRIGNGRTPLDRNGSIRLYPRSYNLQWVKLGHPWTLTFKFETGIETPPVVIPIDGAAGFGFTDEEGSAPLDFSIEDLFAFLVLTFLR